MGSDGLIVNLFRISQNEVGSKIKFTIKELEKENKNVYLK